MTTGELYNMIGLLLNKYAVERFGYNGDPLNPNDYTLTVIYNRMQTEWAEKIAHSVMLQNEATEREQYLLHVMTDNATITDITPITNTNYPQGEGYKYFTAELECSRELLSIISEIATCTAVNACTGAEYSTSTKVKTLQFIDAWRKLKDPFSYRTGNIYRLPDIERNDNNIILNYVANGLDIDSINVSFIQNPAPILFVKLPDNMTINGQSDITPEDEILKFPNWVYKELADATAIEVLKTIGIGVDKEKENKK